MNMVGTPYTAVQRSLSTAASTSRGVVGFEDDHGQAPVVDAGR